VFSNGVEELKKNSTTNVGNTKPIKDTKIESKN
jgi:hypothetical protein